VLECEGDTNGDGDCQRCFRSGCLLNFFRREDISNLVMSVEEQQAFVQSAVPFRYVETAGVVEGYRSRDGKILVTKCILAGLLLVLCSSVGCTSHVQPQVRSDNVEIATALRR
jgi:hypothetical protein